MLQAHGLSYSPDPKVGNLFENIDITVGRGEKIALVGRNGVGKTLLLRILAGALTPTSGYVVIPGGSQIAYLPQDFDLAFDGTLDDLFAQRNNVPPHAIAKSMHRLGVSPHLLFREFSTLSLGERMRGAIAALIASEPDILVLDEPTNHLDIAAKEWLEEFLRDCPEAVVFACHDRSVINAVATRVVELERGGLTGYSGDYDAMVEQKQTARDTQLESWIRHQHEDRRLRIAAESVYVQAAKVIRKPTGPKYDRKKSPFYSAKQARMDQRAKAILSRVNRARKDEPEKPFQDKKLSLEFPVIAFRSSQPLAARGVRKSYDGRVLFDGLNITVEYGSRIAIVGPNGVGKTTLFRILIGVEAADAGEIVWSADARVATLSQARDGLDMTLPALRSLDPPDASAEDFARNALARLGMRGETASRPVGVLSVGERTKVEIIAMMLSGANVLLLDEPTNHLDLASVEALEGALAEFPGAILFTSHDRSFVARLATEVISIG